MAQTIEEKLGKGAIAESVGKGPKQFVETYNSVSELETAIEI